MSFKQRQQFDEIYAQHKNLVATFIRLRLSRSADQDEVFQDTWIDFFHALAKETPKSPRSYLLKIAYRKTLKMNQARRLELLPLSTPMVAPKENPDLRELMDHALLQLTPERRDVFIMKHKLNLNYEEISLVLDIPTGTVASRLHGAIKDLRTALIRSGLETSFGDQK